MCASFLRRRSSCCCWMVLMGDLSRPLRVDRRDRQRKGDLRTGYVDECNGGSGGLQVIVAQIEAPCALPQTPGEAGPPDAVPPVRIEVPAGAAARVPDARPEPPL